MTPEGGTAQVMTISEAVYWAAAHEAAKGFIPQAAKTWANLTDRPWNRVAMERVLAEFAIHLSRTGAQP